MFDFFGCRKRAYLASPIFQQQLSFARDVKDMIRGMSTSHYPIRIKVSYASKTYFLLTFSTLITNDALKSSLDAYYDAFYRSGSGSNDLQQTFLNDIQGRLFSDPQNLARFQKYEQANILDLSSLLSQGFGLPNRNGIPYTSPSDGIYHFSYSFGFDTIWAGKQYESTRISQGEITYYTQIFGEEVDRS